MNLAESIVKVVWRERPANGETCDGCGDDCFLGVVHRSYLMIHKADKLHKMPFALCPECFSEYKKLDT